MINIPALYRVLGVLAVMASLFLSGMWFGSDLKNSEWTIKDANRIINDDSVQNAIASSRAQHISALQEAQNNADNAYQRGLEDGKEDSERTIADLRDGNKRLRNRFTCNSRTENNSVSGSGSGSVDAASQGGLQREDAEFLIRFASECDDNAKRIAALQISLSSCQDTLRKVVNSAPLRPVAAFLGHRE